MTTITHDELVHSFTSCTPTGVNNATRSRHFLMMTPSRDAATIFHAAVTTDPGAPAVPIATLHNVGPRSCIYMYRHAELCSHRGGVTQKLYSAIRTAADARGIPVFYSVLDGVLPDCRTLHDHEGRAAVFSGVYAAGLLDVMNELNTRIMSIYQTPSSHEASALCRTLRGVWAQYSLFCQIPFHQHVIRDMGGEVWRPEWRLSRFNLEVDRFEVPLTAQEVDEERALRRAVMFNGGPMFVQAFIESRPYTRDVTPEEVVHAANTARTAVLMRRSRARCAAARAQVQQWGSAKEQVLRGRVQGE